MLTLDITLITMLTALTSAIASPVQALRYCR
jgi:hypothetical protein